MDLVIITSGGKTDLFWIDSEVIARRIAIDNHPVWTGIGVDYTKVKIYNPAKTVVDSFYCNL